MTDKLTVTQYAREAVAKQVEAAFYDECEYAQEMRQGLHDSDPNLQHFARFEAETIARTNTTTELAEALRALLARQGHSEPKLADGRKLSDDTIVTILCTTGDIRRARKALALHDRGER